MPIERKVLKNLRASAAVLVLVTERGVESVWVRQEIGAVVADKLVIPMVERGADTSRLGMIASRDRLHFGRDDLGEATAALAAYIGKKAGEKDAKGTRHCSF